MRWGGWISEQLSIIAECLSPLALLRLMATPKMLKK
jgi:hypothetical protein